MASLGNSRIVFLIVLICSFAIGYSGLLLYAMYNDFLDTYTLDGCRDLMLTIYIGCLVIMSLTHKSGIEKEIIILGLIYFISIYLWRSLNNFQLFLLTTQWKLIFINGFTIFYALVIYVNARKFDLLNDNE